MYKVPDPSTLSLTYSSICDFDAGFGFIFTFWQEANITAELEQYGLLTFEFEGDPKLLEVHVFAARKWTGEPQESEEVFVCLFVCLFVCAYSVFCMHCFCCEQMRPWCRGYTSSNLVI